MCPGSPEPSGPVVTLVTRGCAILLPALSRPLDAHRSDGPAQTGGAEGEVARVFFAVFVTKHSRCTSPSVPTCSWTTSGSGRDAPAPPAGPHSLLFLPAPCLCATHTHALIHIHVQTPTHAQSHRPYTHAEVCIQRHTCTHIQFIYPTHLHVHTFAYTPCACTHTQTHIAYTCTLEHSYV